MLVFGDVEQQVQPGDLQRRIREDLDRLDEGSPGVDRHAALVSAFLRAGDLVQAALDRELHMRGCDDVTTAMQEGMQILTSLAAAVDASWRGKAVSASGLELLRQQLGDIAGDAAITTKLAEGYAFYAVYPESYAAAARQSGLSPRIRVIGIRSIGATLGAMVAAALGADPPISLRPTGHPFDRRLTVSAGLAERLLAGEPEAYAVVDEGPGLSGSSFGCVADWLHDHGVPRARIHFFPSHGNGPGEKAGPKQQAHWWAAPRHSHSFEDLLIKSGRLGGWVSELTGALRGELVDLSGGKWRELLVEAAPALPGAPQWERRKYLAHTSSGRWLLKFAGLGAEGQRKLELARHLERSGFGPEVAGICHGFLVQRWVEAPPLTTTAMPRELLVDQLAGYLACRSALPAPPDSGAPLPRLAEMAAFNAAAALGPAAGRAIEERLRSAAAPGPGNRVEVDGRMHQWEWLVGAGGLVKTDGLDHGRAHDFIGAQDIAWDVAGAMVEHDLTDPEIEQLILRLERLTGHALDRALLDFLLPCYLGFQLGAWTLAQGPNSAIAGRYGARLRALLKLQ